jgi:hypothetical protein
MDSIGGEMLRIDADIADAHRHIRAAVDGSPSKPLNDKVADGDHEIDGINLTGMADGLVPLNGFMRSKTI